MTARLGLALICLHGWLLLVSARYQCQVIDEFGHIPSGLCHWQTGQFSAYRVNPPLARMLATLPLWLTQPAGDWRQLDGPPGYRSEWPIGQTFVRNNSANYLDLLRLARWAGIGWSLFGAWLVWCWTHELFGPRAGLLALTIWCLEPTLLAMGPLVVPDVPAAVAGLAASYGLYRLTCRPSLGLAVYAGVWLGLALLCKFTLLILLGLWPVLLACSPTWRNSMNRGLQLALLFSAAWLVLHAGYGFQGMAPRLGDFHFVSRSLRGDNGNRFRGTWLAEVRLPLPAEAVRGIDVQRRDFEGGFRAYLAGEWRDGGWWHYYIYALFVKVPVGFLALMLWGVWRCWLARPGGGQVWQLVLLLSPAVIYAVVSSQTGLNGFARYALPAWPFLIVAAGAVLAGRGRWRHLLAVGLLAWGASSSLAESPRWFAYFNELAGGSANGHRHLLDGNLDWGQDLLALRDWIDAHPEAKPLYVTPYSALPLSVLGIHAPPSPRGRAGLFADDPEYQRRFGPQPGYHAVSVNYVMGAEFMIRDHRGHVHNIGPDDLTYFATMQPIARLGGMWIYFIDSR